jgi:putative redox protein
VNVDWRDQNVEEFHMNELEKGSLENLLMGDPQVEVRGRGTALAQEIILGLHHLTADEPAASGGTDTGPTPYDLLLGALGACTSMTVGMYARQKKWPLEGIVVRLRHSRIHAEDCAGCDTKIGFIDHIDREIELAGPLTDEQRSRLLEIAGKCPIHRTLTSEIDIRSWLA